jgi:hypothetical protein
MAHTAVYSTARWRALPRDYCAVELLFGAAAGPCAGLIHRHHVDPADPHSRTLSCCAGHHSRLHVVIQLLERGQTRVCPHPHRTREGRDACERRLNRTV